MNFVRYGGKYKKCERTTKQQQQKDRSKELKLKSNSSNGYELQRSINHHAEMIIKIEKRIKMKTTKERKEANEKKKLLAKWKEIANEIGFLVNFESTKKWVMNTKSEFMCWLAAWINYLWNWCRYAGGNTDAPGKCG